jgi:glycosyltransferase involved in cell wall biosynthesis
MNLPPIVSVVLPTLNRAKTLGRAIQSVLDQTFGDFELIIVDDGSTDDTKLVFDKYAGQEKVRLISQLVPGCSAARNIGVCVSRGRYVAFQDSDDEWVPDKLEKAVEALEDSGPEVGVFYSDMIRIEEDGRQSYWHSPDVERGVLINERILDFQVACIGIQSAVIKRDCFSKVGLFDERLPRFIDLELFIRLADQFDFIHCREPLVWYYGGSGISTDSRAQVIARTYLIEKYHERLEVNPYYLPGQHLQLRIAIQHEENQSIVARLREQERELQTAVQQMQSRIAMQQEENQLIAARLREQERGRQTAVQQLQLRIATQQEENQSIAAKLREQERGMQTAVQHLQLRIAVQQEQNHLISARLREQERELQTIRKSLGWRLLDWYGRTIKYPYLLPVYNLLGIDRSYRS